MKEFSLVENDGNKYPELPQGLVLAYGNKRDDVVAFTDYDGKTDRSQPGNVSGEWFPLGVDTDSIMAWHGERKKERNVYYGKVIWKKERKR